MTQTELIDKLIADNDGMIRTSQVTEAGITKPVFYQYVKENNLEKIAHGVYATSDSWTDAMYLLHLRCKQAVFSHETALFLHDLTNCEFSGVDINTKSPKTEVVDASSLRDTLEFYFQKVYIM